MEDDEQGEEKVKARTDKGSGENRQAIEDLVAEVESRHGEILVHDRPLVQRTRTLASAVDSRPDDSQLAIQYALAVKELRLQVLSASEDRFKQAIWTIRTGCDQHLQSGDSHCGECCAELHGLDHVEMWEFPAREGAMSDDDYARMILYDFLRYGSRFRS